MSTYLDFVYNTFVLFAGSSLFQIIGITIFAFAVLIIIIAIIKGIINV